MEKEVKKYDALKNDFKKLFCAEKDEFERRCILEPITDGNHWICSDGKIALYIDKWNISCSEEIDIHTELIVRIVNGVSECLDTIYDLDDMQIFLSKLTMKNIYGKMEQRCSNCDGSGYSSCSHCGSEIECKKCEGTGIVNVDSDIIIGHDYADDICIDIAGLTVLPKYLQKLVEVGKLIGEHKIYSVNIQEKYIIFNFASLKVIIICNTVENVIKYNN